MTTKIEPMKDYRQHLRGFIVVWITLTILIGVATFLGIYIGTSNVEEGNTTSVAQNEAPSDSNTNNAAPPPIAPVVDTDNANKQPDNSAEQDQDEVINAAPEQASVDSVEGDENAAANANVEIAPSTTDVEAAGLADVRSAPAVGQVPPLQGEATPIPQPTVPPRQESHFDLGIQMVQNFQNDENAMRGYMDAAANQLRLNWVKLQVRWEFVEPEPGVYDWERFDLFFRLASEYNLKVLISVVTAPDWARESGADLAKHGPPADNQRFANFIGVMILRYYGQIHAVEVWNEMNLDREWASPQGLSAANYVAMVRTVKETLHGTPDRPGLDPNVMIISGALSPTGFDNNVNAISDSRYTDMLISAGVLNYIDCFGAHHNGYNIGPNVPYDAVPNDPTATFRGPFDNPHYSWSFYSTLNLYANKIRAAGSNIPLCVTEFGWAVAEDLDATYRPIPGFEFAEDNTLDEQRQFMIEAIQLMEQWGFVRLAMIWNLNFGPEASWDLSREYRDNIPYSLVRPGYIPAPVWAYLSDLDFRGRIH